MNKGIWNALAAYALWGVFPIYWKLLHEVPAIEVIGHRIGWSFLLLIGIILLTRQWQNFRTAALTPKLIGIYTLAGVLLTINWLIYVWGVNAGFIVETSLGYFINPLISVLLGVFFLRERLRAVQWAAVALAATGVLYLTITYGRPPWIALSLAVSFGIYGLVKKLAPLGSLYGLTLETALVFPMALVYLVFVGATGTGAFLHHGALIDILLIGTGVVTSIPLLMFASAARQIPLTMVGLLQYIAPTLQFLIGIFLYHEPFDQSRLIGFSLVWLALLMFWVENFMSSRVSTHPFAEMGKS
ncbi:MAG TPA: EamA family transporter RarD [Anaerolineales bacterium]|jgi:chloramphenicol-sensitive protein RarD|nr:EamA family transporter RarD [Anaerolineales bacterium]